MAKHSRWIPAQLCNPLRCLRREKAAILTPVQADSPKRVAACVNYVCTVEIGDTKIVRPVWIWRNELAGCMSTKISHVNRAISLAALAPAVEIITAAGVEMIRPLKFEMRIDQFEAPGSFNFNEIRLLRRPAPVAFSQVE